VYQPVFFYCLRKLIFHHHPKAPKFIRLWRGLSWGFVIPDLIANPFLRFAVICHWASLSGRNVFAMAD